MICPVCDSKRAVPVEKRSRVPVLMNKLYPSHEEARRAACGNLDVVHCEDCGFVWNQAFDPELIVYDASYENDQTNSPAFLDHVKARVADVLAALPQGALLNFLEIGCGQGGFIREVAREAGPRLCSAEGYDPAWRGTDGEGRTGGRIHKLYFNEVSARRLTHTPNVVATRHTIEHVPQPITFLSTIRRSLGPDSRARLFVETPSVTWILRHEAMQDLFYEHCSIFTAQALKYALEKSGFQVLRVDDVFGGQYLWAEAEAQNRVAAKPPRGAELGNLTDGRRRFIGRWRTAVIDSRSEGLVAIWGAGAKGVTFSILIDPDGTFIDHVVDINPAKQGLHIAGVGLPVLSPEVSSERNPRTIFVMNPNYAAEIREQARRVGITARLVPLE
jgi:SAM-dependent methyltransferase